MWSRSLLVVAFLAHIVTHVASQCGCNPGDVVTNDGTLPANFTFGTVTLTPSFDGCDLTVTCEGMSPLSLGIYYSSTADGLNPIYDPYNSALLTFQDNPPNPPAPSTLSFFSLRCNAGTWYPYIADSDYLVVNDPSGDPTIWITYNEIFCTAQDDPYPTSKFAFAIGSLENPPLSLIIMDPQCSSMVNDHSPCCPITKLPAELRWKIFGYLHESIGTMRLVSKSWAAIVDEWMIPVNLPSIVHLNICEELPEMMNIEIKINGSEEACFRSLGKFIATLDKNKVQRTYWPSTDLWQSTSFSFDIPYGGSEFEHFCSALSSTVRRMWIRRNENDCSQFFAAVSEMITKIKNIGELTLSRYCINAQSIENLLRVVSSCSFRKLCCCVDASSMSQIRRFLLFASEQISTIELRFSDIDKEEVDEMDWVDLTLEMFDEAATSVDVNNYLLPIYTIEDVRSICQSLMSRGKPFHFRSILHEKPGAIIVKGMYKRVIKSSHQYIVDTASQPPPPNAVLY